MFLESFLDGLDLDFAVALRDVGLRSEPAEGCDRIILTVLRQQPTWRAGDEQGEENDDYSFCVRDVELQRYMALTSGENELDAGDSFPAHTIGFGGEGLVDSGGNDAPGIEEELQGDDDQTTERSRDNFRLVYAEKDWSISLERNRANRATHVTSTSTRPTEM